MCPHIPATKAPHWRKNEESKIWATGESIDRSAQPIGHGQEKAVMQINLPSSSAHLLEAENPATNPTGPDDWVPHLRQLLKLKPNVHGNRIARCVNPSEPHVPVRQHARRRSLANEIAPDSDKGEPSRHSGGAGVGTSQQQAGVRPGPGREAACTPITGGTRCGMDRLVHRTWREVQSSG